MLLRAPSDAGARLRRSKSASTVQRVTAPVLETLDPEVAHQHALAAAATAYVKAYGREMPGLDKSRAPDFTRSKPNQSRTSTEGRHFPPKESSFRSTTSQKSDQRPKSSRLSTVLGLGTESSLPLYNASIADKMPVLRPSSTPVDENIRPNSQPKPYRSHVVSSIASQQIRKARSMYYASSVQTGSPIPRPPAKYLTSPPLASTTPCNSIRPRTPPTEVASLPSRLPPVSAATNHESINKARDKVLQDFQQRPVRHTPSLFLAPFKKRHEKAKNKAALAQSTRESSYASSTPLDSVVEAVIADFKPPKEKRSFSSSLRKKFKKVFGRSSSNTTSVPAQQVEASRDYFTERSPRISPLPGQHGNLDIPSPDDQILARVRSRTPSMEAGVLNRVRPGSGCSSRSDVDMSIATASRVTSWTTSSAGNTLTSRELNRLSVIHEAKDSLASELNHPTMGSPKRKPPPIPTFAAFREPMPIEGLTEGASTPVDPKRVFSALMKEIGSTKAVHPSTGPALSTAEVSDVFISTPSLDAHTAPSDATMSSPPEHSAGTSNSGSAQPPKSTIRTVTPEPVGKNLDRATSIRGAVRIPKPDSGDSTSDSEVQDDNFSITQHTDKPRYRFNRDLLPTKGTSPTPEQIKRRVEMSRSRCKMPLEASRSSFSPNSTHKAVEVTNTPQSLFHKQLRNSGTVESAPDFTTSTPPQDSMLDISSSPKGRTLFSPLSPSVYSRNTDGVSILPSESVGSLDQTQLEEGGTAVIITSRPVKSYVIGSPSPQRGAHSNHSSKDWKAWLSHEVSELGSLPQEDITINSFHVGSGHHREPTQISEEDETEDDKSATPRVLEDENRSHRATDSSASALAHVEEDNRSHRATDSNVSAAPPMASEKSEASPKPSVDPSQTRKPPHPDQSPRPRLPLRSHCSSTSSDRPRSTRFSSMSSDRQFVYRPRQDVQLLERMNDRFPYIETGRRFSQTSLKTTQTRRTTSTESPPLRSTPSPKVYSDLSVHSPNDTSGPKQVLEDSAISVENDKENRKDTENSVPVNSLSVPQNLVRPKSLQVLGHSTWSNDSGSLAHVNVSAHKDASKRNSVSGITPPRHRIRPSNLSVGNLSVRAKSVFDLRTNRGAATPPPLTVHGSSKLGPHGSSASTRYPVTIRAVPEGDAYPFPVTPSPRSSPRQPATPARSLHLKRSSSTLALNKEPSPGLEERGIDAIIESEETPEGLKRAGPVTPTAGQRMAERFLRERKSGSMAGNPTRMSTSTAFL